MWGGGVVEVVDEILSGKNNAAGLTINWNCFGSNGQEKADLSRGVLERFTRRAPNDWTPNGFGNAHVKTVANPRMISYMSNPHFAFYFEGVFAVNENGGYVQGPFNNPVTTDKIVINHYNVKSREEYAIKRGRGRADTAQNTYDDKGFNDHDRNEEFDDGILRYRFERAKKFKPPDMIHANERLLNALMKNLAPTLVPTTLPQFYTGKLETFLTCRAVAAHLKTKLTDDAPATFFEKASLIAILRSLIGMSFADARLFVRELPNLLSLPYPEVKELRNAAAQIIPQMMNAMRINTMWRDFVELEYTKDLLNIGG